MSLVDVYDFDKTIYAGDCTLDFWKACICRYPCALIPLPFAAIAGAVHKCGLCSKEQFKETFYRFLRYVPNVEDMVRHFWDDSFSKINAWYLKQRKDSDLIISASPDFLISVACERLRVRYIASKVNPSTGKLEGPNCAGEEKVKRLIEVYPNAVVERFYSDARTDEPLARLAAHAYLVQNGCITEWNL